MKLNYEANDEKIIRQTYFNDRIVRSSEVYKGCLSGNQINSKATIFYF